ncbi:MAG: selenocysteine-specific translation elongation factor [Acidimicrobiia bacterium]
MRVVATAGHVDHGKSTLVLTLTGTDPDRFAEEKRRGVTIDLGFAHTVLPSGASISFVDVPGHVRFLKNMLAGVGAVDACLFVVAATEAWKPQSEEHLRILELLGVRHGVVALTKVDLVDDDHRMLARMDIDDAVAGTFLATAEVVEVAATSGIGISELRDALDRLVVATPMATDQGRPKLWVDRSFAAKGSGTVVTGTLIGGSVDVDDELDIWPGDRRCRVRAIQSLGEHHEQIGPGNRVALNLTGASRDDVGRGHVLIRGAQWRPSTVIDASLAVLASLDHPVSRRGAYVAYIGSGEWPVRVRVLGPDSIAPGESGLVRLHLPAALPLLPGERFILRESGRSETVGGGEILDVAPVRPASKARPDRSVDRVIDERGYITVDELEAITGERRTGTVGAWAIAPAYLEAMGRRIDALVADAGALGFDIAVLDEREREFVASLDHVEVVAGRVRAAEVVDPLASHPYVALLDAGGFATPAADGVDRNELRELIRRGFVIERDGVWFTASLVDRAARVVAQLLHDNPDGFTAAQGRDAFAVTRKHALPLLNELDARGITRRRGDLRIAGPRLPAIES